MTQICGIGLFHLFCNSLIKFPPDQSRGMKGYNLAGLENYFLPGLGIAALAGMLLANLEFAEPGQQNILAADKRCP